ncbi:MAG: DUF5668 domain-containing protein [Bacteroidota bacterium]
MEITTRKRAILGIVLVIIGALFLLDNLGLEIEIPWYVFKWPIVFIILGVVNLISGNPRPALIFFALGTLFYLDVFDVLDLSDYWPVILIIIGLSFILRRGSVSDVSENKEDIFDEVAIFGGTEKKFTSEQLKGGKITTLFGGSKIDLKSSQIATEANIEIFCMFGGTEILVPEDWDVNMNATAILGGSSDERSVSTTGSNSKLNVNGFVMFGSIELKS